MKKCSKCGIEKELSHYSKLYEGLRPSCKKCDKEGKDSYNARLNTIVSSLFERLSKKNLSKNKCYIGIENRLGKTRAEIKEYLHKNFEADIRKIMETGESPSLDRIDSSGHYEEGNVRIISFKENSLRGLEKALEVTSKKIVATFPNGDTQEFDSISDASRKLELKRDTIIDKLKNGTAITSYRIKNKELRGTTFQLKEEFDDYCRTYKQRLL